MVELQDVSFSYTKEVGTLTHVDLTIRPGECVLLCGASGCGKTTITKLVNGLIPAFTEDCTLTGQVLLHGAPVREQPLYQLARQVGSVFQNPKSQFFNMDSDSELAFGLENQGMTRGEILRRLDDTTDRLHLKRLRGRNIFAMSAEKSSCWPLPRSMPWGRNSTFWMSLRPIWIGIPLTGSMIKSHT